MLKNAIFTYFLCAKFPKYSLVLQKWQYSPLREIWGKFARPKKFVATFMPKTGLRPNHIVEWTCSQVVLWDFDQSRDINDAWTSWRWNVINVNLVHIGDIGLTSVNSHQWRWVDVDVNVNVDPTSLMWIHIDVNPTSPMWTKLTLMTSRCHDVPASLISRDWSNREEKALTDSPFVLP